MAVGDMQLHPFTVAHDAAEPLQVRCSDGASDLVVLTDLGSITAHMLERVAGCQALLLECNHDAAMLAASRYPPSLKSRIGGRLGHLSNATAAEILTRCLGPRLRHLSKENNHPELARAALAACWAGEARDVLVAHPAHGFEWLDVG
jgi:phosphoribosyl 1,2-cyclic phosphodiesterase